MATEILMPALSPTMEEGTLAKWLVKEGDTVKSGDILAEIETDKATMEFEAVDEGTIGKLLVAEGTAAVKVNAPIAILLAEGETAGNAPAPKTKSDKIPQDAPPAAAGTPKAEAEAAAQKGYGATGDDPVAAGTANGQPPTPTKPAPQTSGAHDGGERIFASPLARRLAADKGVDLSAIAGSGPNGRIVKADVDAAQPGASKPAAVATTAKAGGTTTPAPSDRTAMPQGMSFETVSKMFADRETQEIQLDGMRKTIAQRLTEAKQTIPHFYLRRSARIDALLAFRTQLNTALEARGTKLSVNDFIIKACALALQEVPDANAVWAGDRILRLRPSDVGVAVAVEGGLFVPVIRDAEAKTLSTLSHEMRELGAKAKRKKLAPHEYQGGSFAISNLGMFGIENFDAVINPPHGAILAVGAGLKQPVVEGDQVRIATMMSMTLSVDHRVIDGALGARLLEAIVRNLENPMAMLA